MQLPPMVSNPKKILLLGAGFTTRNMGVWALTSGAIASALNAYPDARIFVLDYHAEPASYEVEHPRGTAAVDMINVRFSKKFWLPNNILRLLLTALLIKLVPFKGIQDRLFRRNCWLSHIQTADFAGAVSGGDSFSDIYGLARLLYVALPQILCLVVGRPLILLPQTIGPFDSAFGRAAAGYVLKRASRVYSRDRVSIDEAKRLCGKNAARIEFSYDLGFILEPRIRMERVPAWLAERENRSPLVGVNVSGLLYIGGYTQKNMFGLKGDYRHLIHAIIDRFIVEHNAHVMLVPHVMGSAANRESDFLACRAIFEASKDEVRNRLHLIEEEYDHHEIKALIGRCDFFIGSRMHACIAALSQSIPAVGLAYSKKFIGVFSSIGMEGLVFDLREADEDATVRQVGEIFVRRLEFRADLEKKMPAVRDEVMSLFA